MQGGERWLNEEEQRAWRAFFELSNDVKAALDRRLSESHDLLVGEYAVFVRLSETPDRSSRMSELAKLLNLSPSGLTRRVDRLEREGWVVRTPSETDRRVVEVRLTESGMSKLKECAPDHVADVRHELLRHLSPEQIRTLGDTLSHVIEFRETAAST